MSKILDRSREDEVVQLLKEALDEAELSIEQIIPGLIGLVSQFAHLTNDPEQALNESVRLLDDVQ